jgi:exopolysaccharide production protein ExoQ
MPPPLALVLAILFILYLFKRDSRQQYQASRALWIPCIWMMILGSRSVSQWLNLGPPLQSPDDLLEGSPIDRAVFLLLIISGLVVLWRRHISWSKVFRNNIWLTLFFLYCGVSILWSDFPFVASKRWIKALGGPMMALILLTEREPVKAVETVIKRCAYVLIPLSILFIKYYPHLGKGYDEMTGAGFYTGVTTNKNTLGFLCMVFGLFFFYRLCLEWTHKHELNKRTDVLFTVLLLSMIQWLLWIADSKTPFLSLILGILVVAGLGYANVRKHIGIYIVAGILVFSVLQMSFNITENLILGAGRDTTLTGRTELWPVLVNMVVNPWIGHGFESFWLGERLKTLWAAYGFKPNQAHNGYLEIYLNLGWIGLFLLGGVIISCYRKMRKKLMLSSSPGRAEVIDFGRFAMGYLAAFLIYNVTEAGFSSFNLVFMIFLVIAIEYRQPDPGMAQSSPAGLPGVPRKASKVTAERFMTPIR